jgi:hypothetical protein
MPVNYPTNTKVQGNFIGTDITGAGALANTGAGVRLGASGTFVGPGNVIAFNGKQGVVGRDKPGRDIVQLNLLKHSAGN